MSSNPIIAFYGGGVDGSGRTLTQILGWNDEMMEKVHDWVQWVFPNREVSRFNPEAPLMDDEAAEALSSPELRGRVLSAVSRFERFLHLNEERPHWVTRGNHNCLRITRLLKFMVEVGMRPDAEVMLKRLEEIYEANSHLVSTTTVRLWREAVGGEVTHG